QRDRIASQLEREVHQVRPLDKFLLESVGDQLPATLVSREVVELLVTVWPLRNDETRALRDGRRLIDVRSLCAHEKLSLELRVGGDVVEDDAGIDAFHALGDV